MSQLRSVTRAYAVEGHPPAEVIARLNLYHQALRADDLTTLVYAIVEPDRGRLRLVSAGHPPPALLVPGSHARLLGGACPALGIAEVCDPDEIVVDFPPGATLALYTDGLVERRREGIEKGTARLAAALDAARGDLDAVRASVVSACTAEDVDDDVTALFVRAEPALGLNVRFTLVPDPDALAALRRMLRRWLAEVGADADESAAIVLAANEAWQNAIEHGHGFQPVPVSVRFTREDDAVRGDRARRGGPRPAGRRPGPRPRHRADEGPRRRRAPRPRLAARRRRRPAPQDPRARAAEPRARLRHPRRLDAHRAWWRGVARGATLPPVGQ